MNIYIYIPSVFLEYTHLDDPKIQGAVDDLE